MQGWCYPPGQVFGRRMGWFRSGKLRQPWLYRHPYQWRLPIRDEGGVVQPDPVEA